MGESFENSAYCFGSGGERTNTPRIHQNPFVSATDLQYHDAHGADSYAGYTQAVYTFNPKFALTMGIRRARDMLDRRGKPLVLRRIPLSRWASTTPPVAPRRSRQ